jgi:hypothetical protein
VIPLAFDSSGVTGALIINSGDSLQFFIILKNDYQSFGQEREEFVKAFMFLDWQTFGYSKFKINDTTLFGATKQLILKRNNALSSFQYKKTGSKNFLNEDDDPCDIIEIWYNPDGDECNCNGDEYYTGKWNYAGVCNNGVQPPIVVIPGGIGSGVFYPWPNFGDLGGGFPENPPYIPIQFSFSEKLLYLSEQMNLNQTNYNWLLNNEQSVKELFNYLYGHFTSERLQIISEHLEYIISNTGYNDFVQLYRANYFGNNRMMWWEDNNWLETIGNFNLNITNLNNQYSGLTAAEKALIGIFPIQAFIIKQNVPQAFAMSDTKMGGAGGLNDKKDAFRHAFFNAINTRDVPARLIPVPITGSQIVKLFSDAHESEVPVQLELEKQMDLFNNQVGISYCWRCWTKSNNIIADDIMSKLNNGELKYLSPLDFTTFPLYHPQNCSTCTNGIGPSTILLPTNQ